MRQAMERHLKNRKILVAFNGMDTHCIFLICQVGNSNASNVTSSSKKDACE